MYGACSFMVNLNGSALVLRPAQIELALGTKNVAVKIGNPLPPA
jgi:hypothetical protein